MKGDEVISTAKVKRKGRVVLEAMERIRKGGALTAKRVEKAARPESHPLHEFFEWDDSVAGYQYRLRQARDLIAEVVIRRADVMDGKPYRAYLNTRSGFESAPEYHPTEVVLSDRLMRAKMLQVALKDVEMWQHRYRILTELAEIFEAINRTKRRT